jgi:hypothetical protein
MNRAEGRLAEAERELKLERAHQAILKLALRDAIRSLESHGLADLALPLYPVLGDES